MPILLVSGKFIFLDKVFFDPAICSMEVMPNLCHDFFFNSVTFGVLYKDSTQKHLSEGNFKNLVTEEELLNLNMLKAMN